VVEGVPHSGRKCVYEGTLSRIDVRGQPPKFIRLFD